MFPIAFHPIYQHLLPEGHRFPMLKYELLPQQLLHEGTALPTDFYKPEICDLAPVLQVNFDYYEKITTEQTDEIIEKLK